MSLLFAVGNTRHLLLGNIGRKIYSEVILIHMIYDIIYYIIEELIYS
jgi:hypothetical protein